jgi:hypothetical protein
MFVSGHVTDKYKPCIFIDDIAPPTNIWGGSKSNQMSHIFVGVRNI